MNRKGGLICQVVYQARAYPSFCSMKWLEVFLLPLGGMLVHFRVADPALNLPVHINTWVERGTVRVKCLFQDHNTMSPARTWTQTARSWDMSTNHEATIPTK